MPDLTKDKKMKFAMIAFAALVTVTSAKADGFVCSSDDGLNVKVFNQTEASEGTRNGAIMVLSNANISSGRKTIATFPADNTLLSQSGASYSAHVDLRYVESSRKGELIGGTKLGQLRDIDLDVDFSYSTPVSAGKKMAALLTLNKRNGAKIEIDMICKRYLKN